MIGKCVRHLPVMENKKLVGIVTVGDVVKQHIYPLRIGFRFSEPDFTRTLDLSQSQNPRLSITKSLVLLNRKIKISGKLLT
ncbi:MAG: CBS domain-containing protein [Candidatus Scalindua sp.]|nr:CBS domain-containing protein [Candidatus Scalindua sp.]